MKELTEVLTKINFVQLILWIVVILVAIKFLWELIGWMSDKFGIELKSTREKKEKYKLLTDTVNGLAQLKKEVDKDEAETQSVADAIANLSTEIKGIVDRLDKMEEKNDNTERARLKDRIAQSYRVYHDKGCWTEMERESFYELIRDYESHKGDNSFVHTICEPESFTWKII